MDSGSALCAPRQERPHPPQRRHIHRCEGRRCALLPWIREARSVRRGRNGLIHRSGGTFTDVRAGDAVCCHGFGKARSVCREGSDPIRRSGGTFTDVEAEDALCCHGFGKRALCAEKGATSSAAAPAHSPMRGQGTLFAAMDSGKCVHKPSSPGGARGRFLCQALVISRAIAPKPAAAKVARRQSF